MTPSKVLVFDCHSKPRSEDGDDSACHIIEKFRTTEQGLRQLKDLAGFFEIQSGRAWLNARLRRRPGERVDEALLNDLGAAEMDLVQEGLPPREAHALLGRSIFVAYLEDRGCGTLQEVLQRKTTTYRLFQ